MRRQLTEHLDLIDWLEDNFHQLISLSEFIYDRLESTSKVLFAGNGGSASDAQHLAAEFVGRYVKERKPLAAISLTTDTSALTAISNDYGYAEVISRQIAALGVDGDILIVISTSGNSENLIRAVKQAKDQGIYSIGLLGKDGGRLLEDVDEAIVVPSEVTARIQEMHIMIGHLICELIDNKY